MSIWRPKQHVRVIAIGLHFKGRSLLAVEVLDDEGNLKGVRPLGGAVEFGETWQSALKREFKEELGVDIAVNGPPIFFENIYEHHGDVGHEIVLAANVTFDMERFSDVNSVCFKEDDGTACRAAWFDIEHLDSAGPALFPVGLKEHILIGGVI